MQALIDALPQHPGLALVAVFAAALLESMVVIGIAVPGSGLVTLERLIHPAVVITFAFTDPDFAAPAKQLTNLLLAQNLAVEIKHTGVLLVNSTR